MQIKTHSTVLANPEDAFAPNKPAHSWPALFPSATLSQGCGVPLAMGVSLSCPGIKSQPCPQNLHRQVSHSGPHSPTGFISHSRPLRKKKKKILKLQAASTNAQVGKEHQESPITGSSPPPGLNCEDKWLNSKPCGIRAGTWTDLGASPVQQKGKLPPGDLLKVTGHIDAKTHGRDYRSWADKDSNLMPSYLLRDLD